MPLDIALAPEPYRIRGTSEREQTLPELWHNVWTLPKTDPMYYAVHAELHERFVRIATYLFLPLLDRVAGNEIYLHMTRERAAQLSEAIRAAKPKAE